MAKKTMSSKVSLPEVARFKIQKNKKYPQLYIMENLLGDGRYLLTRHDLKELRKHIDLNLNERS